MARITWSFESPSYTWDQPFVLKELDTMEIWCDRLRGTVDFTVELRPDAHPCWYMWHRWSECAARNECENLNPPIPCDHPQQEYLPQYRATMVLPRPPTTCNTAGGTANSGSPRPLNIAYSFQVRVTIKGSVRIRGFLLHAMLREKQPYLGITC